MLKGMTNPTVRSVAEELSKTAESIHEEVMFSVPRHRIYEALLDAKSFTTVMGLGPAPKGAPATISHEAGGAYSVFGGYISGRQIELARDERIVQAWRVANWEPGVYSIARFELKENGAGTKIVFDHTGFPKGEGEHLAQGWHMNYWEPLKKFLS
jgi:activator of HSP90 ATPase